MMFYCMYFSNSNSYYVTKVVGLIINLTLVRKMAINLSATEAVDLVCDDVFDNEREREEHRSYIATAEVLLSRIENWSYPLKLSFQCRLRKLLVFNLRATTAL